MLYGLFSAFVSKGRVKTEILIDYLHIEFFRGKEMVDFEITATFMHQD